MNFVLSLVPKLGTEAAVGTSGGREAGEQRARTCRGNSVARTTAGIHSVVPAPYHEAQLPRARCVTKPSAS